MTREKALAALDDAFTESVKGLFANLRVNEFGEDRDKALAQFRLGFDRLVDDMSAASAVIDKIFSR